MSKKKNKRERKRARHARRVANRAKLKKPAMKLYVTTDNLPAIRTPTAPTVTRLRTSLLLQSSMIVPYVHTARAGHPTWDRLLNHIGRYRLSNRRAELDRWVHGLLQPGQAQPALLLTGPSPAARRLSTRQWDFCFRIGRWCDSQKQPSIAEDVQEVGSVVCKRRG